MSTLKSVFSSPQIVSTHFVGMNDDMLFGLIFLYYEG